VGGGVWLEACPISCSDDAGEGWKGGGVRSLSFKMLFEGKKKGGGETGLRAVAFASLRVSERGKKGGWGGVWRGGVDEPEHLTILFCRPRLCKGGKGERGM